MNTLLTVIAVLIILGAVIGIVLYLGGRSVVEGLKVVVADVAFWVVLVGSILVLVWSLWWLSTGRFEAVKQAQTQTQAEKP